MKRIIEIPDKVVEAIQNGEDYRYDIHTAIAQSIPYDPTEIPQGEWIRGFIDALDKAFSLFDANSTYRGERVLQILEKLKWLEKLKAEKGGAE